MRINWISRLLNEGFSDRPAMKMDQRRLALSLSLFSISLLSVLANSWENTNTTEENPQEHMYKEITRYRIMNAQFECYQRIMKDVNRTREGSMCNRTWDGWLCWDDTEAGITSDQFCPDYFDNFDLTEMVTKICTESGYWFIHPESNRTWTNYTSCRKTIIEGGITAMNLLYLALIGDGLSLISLFISLGIFFHFKSLSCQRITLHKNLFFSFVLNSIASIWLMTSTKNNEVVQQNPTSCRLSMLIHLYLFGCNYFWMLCEGIYLHTLIVVAVFAEKQHLMWYYLLGWGFPLIPALIYAVARSYYHNDNCWISSNTSLLYIIHGPIVAALLVNLFFLLNIIRVLITKLKVTHQTETSLYMKAVRATLILVPLLGIQFVLWPYKPHSHVASEVYDYIMHILIHYQGLLVATIFCFFNGEVQGVLRRHWNQYRIQFGTPLAHPDALRSASYTASSITDVPGCYSIESLTEHFNGKGCHDTETSIFKPESPFA